MVRRIKKSLLFKFILVAVVSSAFVAGLVYYFSTDRLPIYEFSYLRDSKSILKLFDKDWYWLVASSRDEYSPDFALKFKTPDKNPSNFGKLIIKVLREDGKFAGFTAYYKKSFYEGYLLYVAVDRDFRGKGYGEQLSRYAVNDLFSRGCKVVRLVTRTNNIKAKSLYKKIGFEQERVDNGFVYFKMYRK